MPVFLLTSMSTTAAARVFEKVPNAMPRPVTTLPFERFDAATRGCQFASLAASSSANRQRCDGSGVQLVAVAMFLSRNATGSILAA